MASQYVSRYRSLFQYHPGHFTMDGDIMCRVRLDKLEEVTESFPANEITHARLRRLERRVKAEIHRVEDFFREVTEPQRSGQPSGLLRATTRIEFRRQRTVRYDLNPAVFICPKCEFYIDLTDKAASNNLSARDTLCPHCKKTMGQAVFVFTHARCGLVERIKQRRCSECKTPLSYLHLDRDAFFDSYWMCRNRQCKASKQPLVQYCASCRADGLTGDSLRMIPMPAGSAIKPMLLTLVDVDDSDDWRKVALDWLGISGQDREQAFLSQWEEGSPMRIMMERNIASDPDLKRQLIADDMAKNLGRYEGVGDPLIGALKGEPPESVKDLLREFNGAQQAAAAGAALSFPEDMRQLVLKQFKMEVKYIPDLQLKRLVYGYLVGTSDVSHGKLHLFEGEFSTRYVLGDSVNTEALMFALDPDSVAQWLSKLRNKKIDTLKLKRALLNPGAKLVPGSIYSDARILLHTISHLLMRNSEIYSGISRDALSEKIFTPRLAFMIYSQEGSELGALRTTFESRFVFLSWLAAARNLADKCPHGDVCLKRNGACHACLYVAERCCTSLWNEQLDRRYVITPGRTREGYWDG